MWTLKFWKWMGPSAGGREWCSTNSLNIGQDTTHLPIVKSMYRPWAVLVVIRPRHKEPMSKQFHVPGSAFEPGIYHQTNILFKHVVTSQLLEHSVPDRQQKLRQHHDWCNARNPWSKRAADFSSMKSPMWCASVIPLYCPHCFSVLLPDSTTLLMTHGQASGKIAISVLSGPSSPSPPKEIKRKNLSADILSCTLGGCAWMCN